MQTQDGFVLDCSVTMAWCFSGIGYPAGPAAGLPRRQAENGRRCRWRRALQPTLKMIRPFYPLLSNASSRLRRRPHGP